LWHEQTGSIDSIVLDQTVSAMKKRKYSGGGGRIDLVRVTGQKINTLLGGGKNRLSAIVEGRGGGGGLKCHNLRAGRGSGLKGKDGNGPDGVPGIGRRSQGKERGRGLTTKSRSGDVRKGENF